MKLWHLLAPLALLPGVAFGDTPCDRCWTAHIESSPPGATVTANYGDAADPHSAQCVTPCTLSVPPKASVRFDAELKGYRIAPGGPRIYWKNGRLMPDPSVIMFEPIPQALQTVAPPKALLTPSEMSSPPASAAQPTPLPTQREIVLSALRRHAGPYLLLAPYIPGPVLENVREITGQPTDDLLAVLDITNLRNGRNGLYFYPDRVVSKSPVLPASTIYYAALVGRTPRSGWWIVDYGDGIELEANFGLQRRVMLTIDDILVSLSALPEFQYGATDNPQSRASVISTNAARCRSEMLTITFAPDSLTLPPGLMARIIEDRPGCAIASARVVGYANISSSPDKNRDISVQRAEAVRTELVASGVTADKISVEGHGDTEIPTLPEDRGPPPIDRPTLLIVEFD